MGPVIEPVSGKLERGLTVLGEGESWLVKPRQLDETDRLWSPGVRDGVAAGSEFHLTEYFGPVLGIMTAATLDEAIELQNAVDYGLTAGIHSLDADEVARLARTRCEAGNLYVNRPITGAIVRRQPFGGWKRSTVGPSVKAGGPNTLIALGSLAADRRSSPTGDLRLDGLDPRVRRADRGVRAGARLSRDFDARASRRVQRRGGVGERVRRQRATSRRSVSSATCSATGRPPVTIRLAEGGALADLVRVLAAGVLAHAPLADQLGGAAAERAAAAHRGRPRAAAGRARSTVESDADFAARAVAREAAAHPAHRRRRRRRSPPRSAEHPDVAIYSGPVTAAGRIELLPFLREQAVSITAHRFGNPDRAFRSCRLAPSAERCRGCERYPYSVAHRERSA